MTDPHPTKNLIYAVTKDVELIRKCMAGVKLEDPDEYWGAVLRRVEEAVKPRKKARKRVELSEAAKQRYRDAKYGWYDRNLRVIIDDGHYLDPSYPDANTKKGIDEYILNFLKWNGHFENPTNNKGFPVDKTAPKMNIQSGKVEQIVTGEKQWRKSGANKGMQDIDCTLRHPEHPYGIPWKIETKTANDYQSDAQIKFEAKVKGTAGVYSIVWGIDDFLIQYDRLMVRQNVLF